MPRWSLIPLTSNPVRQLFPQRSNRTHMTAGRVGAYTPVMAELDGSAPGQLWSQALVVFSGWSVPADGTAFTLSVLCSFDAFSGNSVVFGMGDSTAAANRTIEILINSSGDHDGGVVNTTPSFRAHNDSNVDVAADGTIYHFLMTGPHAGSFRTRVTNTSTGANTQESRTLVTTTGWTAADTSGWLDLIYFGARSDLTGAYDGGIGDVWFDFSANDAFSDTDAAKFTKATGGYVDPKNDGTGYTGSQPIFFWGGSSIDWSLAAQPNRGSLAGNIILT